MSGRVFNVTDKSHPYKVRLVIIHMGATLTSPWWYYETPDGTLRGDTREYEGGLPRIYEEIGLGWPVVIASEPRDPSGGRVVNV